jgi:hypothetical protein
MESQHAHAVLGHNSDRLSTEHLSKKNDEFKEESKDPFASGQSVEKLEPSNDTEPVQEYVHGIKLLMIISGLIFGSFLMLLDTSIIATVSLSKGGLICNTKKVSNQNCVCAGYSTNHDRLSRFGGCRLVWCILSTR